MGIVTFNRLSLNIAGHPLLDHVDWQIQDNERIALVGRNGAGKSSLLQLLQGKVLPDGGQINKVANLTINGLVQDIPSTTQESVYHFLVRDLPNIGSVLAEFHHHSKGGDLKRLAVCQQHMDNLHAWDALPRVEMMATRLGIDINAEMKELSGGMKRRVLLAAALIAEPQLLLLDEPTNHLDINAIEWLETYLKAYHGSFIVVTHDREFLSQVATRITEIDRGKLYNYHCNYKTYLDRREARRLEEEKHNKEFDRRLSEEEVWIRTGIQARRTRNEGRVRALKAMREAYKARRVAVGKINPLEINTTRSGALVLEAKHVHYQVGGKKLLDNLSLLVTKGDKLGIIGPNGCGKTTLIRLLLGEIQPDSGKIKQGTALQVAYFDQMRTELQDDQTVMYNVADGADFVTINGKNKHVATYLSEFLFSSERFNQSVSTLSGGEKNRLLLAKLLAKPVNLLIMDEPTNDLDIETLELLETLLVNYQGTLLLISHDRAFINQVVTSVLVWEGEGEFNEYVGGYEDYRQNKKTEREIKPAILKTSQRVNTKLTFNEQRELGNLPRQIEQLEQKIANLQEQMATPGFYQQDAILISQSNQELAKNELLLIQLYQRWENLEERS